MNTKNWGSLASPTNRPTQSEPGAPARIGGCCPVKKNPQFLASSVPRPWPDDPYLWVELMGGLMSARPLLVLQLMTARPTFCSTVSTLFHSRPGGIPKSFLQLKSMKSKIDSWFIESKTDIDPMIEAITVINTCTRFAKIFRFDRLAFCKVFLQLYNLTSNF